MRSVSELGVRCIRRGDRPLAFLPAVLVGTVLLSLPVSTAGPTGAPAADRAVHRDSAVCVTGLTTVDTATYWSRSGRP